MTKAFNQNQMECIFQEAGCELLDTYKNKYTPVRFRCKCGKISTITYSSFRRGSRCLACGGKRKYTFEEIKEEFAKRGCTLLESHYINCFHKMRAICSCGTEYRTSWNNLQQGRQCPNCGRRKNSESISGHKHYAWIEDREEYKLRRVICVKCHSALFSALRAIRAKKITKSFKILNYTPRQLQGHIITHPNWQRVQNKEWHLDHVFPIKAFCDYGIKDIAIINCLENLQPLEGRENLKKHKRYDKVEFEKWLASKGIDIR